MSVAQLAAFKKGRLPDFRTILRIKLGAIAAFIGYHTDVSRILGVGRFDLRRYRQGVRMPGKTKVYDRIDRAYEYIVAAMAGEWKQPRRNRVRLTDSLLGEPRRAINWDETCGRCGHPRRYHRYSRACNNCPCKKFV